MVSKKNFTLLVVSSITPFFAVLAIILGKDCSFVFDSDGIMFSDVSNYFANAVFSDIVTRRCLFLLWLLGS